MKILHISHHKGCINDFNYVCNNLNLNCEVLSSLKNCNTNKNVSTLYLNNGAHYNITKDRAKYYWNKYKNYFNEFDCIITSDTAPLCRIFLDNNWKKKLIVWICNRFDYSHRDYKNGIGINFPDKEYYQMIKESVKLKNVYFIGYTIFENYYCKHIRNVDIGTNVIRPIGCISKLYNNFNEKKCLKNTIFVPYYHNDTKMIDLKKQIESLGFNSYSGKYEGPLDLLNYKAIVHIPYAWSNLAFFEMFSIGLVYFIPSIDFLKQIKKGRNFFWSPPYVENVLHISEWYCNEYKNLLIYFNSWDDLKNKINNLDYENHKLKLKEYGMKHKNNVLSKWKNILLN
jgi:hypothetical protein